MPMILVMSKTSTGQSAITLEETVEPEDLANDHHADQLIERVGWAVTDAKEAEDTSGVRRPPRARRRSVEQEVYENLYGKQT